jgi:hypothetical protein
MNTKDVVTTTVVLLVGLGVGFTMGRMQPATVAPPDAGQQAATQPEDVQPVVAQPAAKADEAAENTDSDKAEPPAKVKYKMPPGLLPPDGGEAPVNIKDKLPNTAFGLKFAPILGDLQKAKVAVIVYSDFE